MSMNRKGVSKADQGGAGRTSPRLSPIRETRIFPLNIPIQFSDAQQSISSVCGKCEAGSVLQTKATNFTNQLNQTLQSRMLTSGCILEGCQNTASSQNGHNGNVSVAFTLFVQRSSVIINVDSSSLDGGPIHRSIGPLSMEAVQLCQCAVLLIIIR